MDNSNSTFSIEPMQGSSRVLTYDEFRDQWQKQHPASLPQKRNIALPFPSWLPIAVLVMFSSAVLLSAVHTIPTVYDAIPVTDVISEVVRRAAAHAAVFVIELSLFIAVYASASGKTHTYTAIEIVSFVGALAANLDSVLSTVSDSDIGGTIVGVIVGSIPPLAAALSGAVYVRMHRSNTHARQQIDEAYREDLKQLDTIVLTAYRKYEKDMEKLLSARSYRQPDTAYLSASVLSDQTDNRQTRGAASGYDRTPDGQQKVIEWLSNHPDSVNQPSRTIASLMAADGIKVGHDTANKGRNAWVNARAVSPTISTNGDHAE